MSREYTKCDIDGVPRLVQKIKYRGDRLSWECNLFDGSIAELDEYQLFGGMSSALRDRLKIGNAEIYQFAEDYLNDIYMLLNLKKDQERLLLKFKENRNNV